MPYVNPPPEGSKSIPPLFRFPAIRATAMACCFIGSVLSMTTYAKQPPFSAHAVLTAPQKATLSTQITGQITHLHFKKGDSFKQGDLLVEMDCTRYQMEAKKAAAVLRQARVAYTTNKKLAKLKAVDAVALAGAQSKYEHALAETRIYKDQVAACNIIAPFSGTVVKTHVYTHENVGLHQPLIDILDDQSLEIEMFIPSAWMQWIKVGMGFTIQVAETQHRYAAHITHIIPKVDAVSQSIPIKGKFDKVDRTLIAGMSGEAHFTPLPQSHAAHAPSTTTTAPPSHSDAQGT